MVNSRRIRRRRASFSRSALAATFSFSADGGGHACGVKTDGTVVCWLELWWEWSDYDPSPPPGASSSVRLPAPILYWVDEEAQKIQRVTGEDDAQTVQDLAASTDGLVMPGSIALNPLDGKMYWTDDGNPETADGAIRRANLDGSGPVENVKTGLADPVGIALDLDAGYLYWADREQGAIYRGNLADINEAGLQTPAETLIGNLNKPYQVALDTANGRMYWTERGGSKIRYVDLDAPFITATDVVFEYPLVAPENPFGLALDPLAGKMYWTERGTGLNGGDQIRRANLDGQNGEVLVDSTPYSLSGITVDPGSGKLYWTDETSGSIWRLDPSVRNAMPEEVITGLTAPEGIVMAAASHPDWLPLVALYRATDGENWTTNDGWLSDAPLGEWYGVTTDGDGRVTELYLNRNGLSGMLPSELGTLAHLIDLDLEGNRLSGPIPAEMGNLTGLEWLDLSGNRLTGPIPAELGGLEHLVWLELDSNSLSGPIPSELGNLSELTVLDLSRNNLTGGIPTELGNLANLTNLSLAANWLGTPTGAQFASRYVPEEIPADLGRLRALRVLDLSDNGFGGTIPEGFGKGYRALEVLDLGHNFLTGAIPDDLGYLGYLTSLVTLRLNNNYFTGPLPPGLGNLNNLTELDLSHNSLSGEVPPAIRNLTNLKELYLNDNQLTGKIPEEIGYPPALTKLYLHNNRWSPDGGCTPNILRHLVSSQNDLPAFCSTPGEERDRKALVALYKATNGPAWENQENWLSPNASIGEWEGVTVDDNGRVTALNLSLNNLVGTLPSVLANLTYLQHLDLSANELTGPIPREWEDLEHIDYLNLVGNELEYSNGDCTPPLLHHAFENAYQEIRDERASLLNSAGEVGQEVRDATIATLFAGATFFVHELEAINPDWGGRNDFVDKTFGLELPPCAPLLDLPEGWPDVQSQTSRTDAQALVTIYDYYVENGNSPNEINKFDKGGGWTDDFFAYADSDDSRDDCPDENPFATRNRFIGANENIHGVWTEKIAGCHRVVRLDLDKRALKGGIPPDIGRLGQLKELNLSRNGSGGHRGLSGTIPPELGHLTNLRKLALNDNQLSGEIPEELGNLTNMKFLALNANDFQGEMPLELGNMIQLEHLKLVDSGLEGCLPPTLRQNVAPSAVSIVQVISPGKIARVLAKAGKLGKKTKTLNTFFEAIEDTTNVTSLKARIVEPLVNSVYDHWFARFAKMLGDGSAETQSLSRKIVESAIKGHLEKLIGLVYDSVKSILLAQELLGGTPIGDLANAHIKGVTTVVNLGLKALELLGHVLTPIDKILKPGSTSGFTSLGDDVSLNCSGLLPSPR